MVILRINKCVALFDDNGNPPFVNYLFIIPFVAWDKLKIQSIGEKRKSVHYTY
jgi:hypothetical protein